MQWWGEAFEAWTKLWLSSRRTIFVWGCLPALILALWTFFKIVVWAGGVVVLLVIGLIGGGIHLAMSGGQR